MAHMLVSFIVVVSWLSSRVKAMHSTRRSPTCRYAAAYGPSDVAAGCVAGDVLWVLEESSA